MGIWKKRNKKKPVPCNSICLSCFVICMWFAVDLSGAIGAAAERSNQMMHNGLLKYEIYRDEITRPIIQWAANVIEIKWNWLRLICSLLSAVPHSLCSLCCCQRWNTAHVKWAKELNITGRFQRWLFVFPFYYCERCKSILPIGNWSLCQRFGLDGCVVRSPRSR